VNVRLATFRLKRLSHEALVGASLASSLLNPLSFFMHTMVGVPNIFGQLPPDNLRPVKQFIYQHSGRPDLTVQFSNKTELGFGFLRCTGNWHGHYTCTSWKVGRYWMDHDETTLRVLFRYKEPTGFLVERVLFFDGAWGPLGAWRSDLVIMWPIPVNEGYWNWMGGDRHWDHFHRPRHPELPHAIHLALTNEAHGDEDDAEWIFVREFVD